MTQSQEDYLEMVSFLSDEGEVRVTDIAARLGFSKASVSAALKSLEEQGFVQHQRYRKVALTETGKELAEKVRQKHDLITEFLEHKLGVSAEIAEKDACKIEHIISDETYEKMKEFLKSGTD
jgi:DtxR family Mn-dependent transcriptional regulator